MSFDASFIKIVSLSSSYDSSTSPSFCTASAAASSAVLLNSSILYFSSS